MRMGKVTVMLVCDRCMCGGGGGGGLSCLKIMDIIGDKKLTEGWIKKDLGRKEKKRKRKQYFIFVKSN